MPRVTGEKRRAEEDDYEDDDFVVKPKRIHLNGAVNGQIGPCAGHEYEEEEVSEESEPEEVLADPSDLFDSQTESEPEPEVGIDYALTEKPRKRCVFVDDEAVESDGNEEDDDSEYETVDDGESDDMESGSHDVDSSDSDRDKSIRSPLRKADYMDDEAEECNDICEVYPALRGKEQLSDSERSSESEEDTQDHMDGVNVSEHDQVDDDDDGGQIFRRKHRRNILFSDSEGDEPDANTRAPQPPAAGLHLNAKGSVTRRAGIVDYSDSDDHSISTKVTGHESVLPILRPARRQLLTENRIRYLKLRQLVKPWTVIDISPNGS